MNKLFTLLLLLLAFSLFSCGADLNDEKIEIGGTNSAGMDTPQGQGGQTEVPNGGSSSTDKPGSIGQGDAPFGSSSTSDPQQTNDQPKNIGNTQITTPDVDEPDPEPIVEDPPPATVNTANDVKANFSLSGADKIAYINEPFTITNSISPETIEGWDFSWDANGDGRSDGSGARRINYTYSSIGPKTIKVRASKPDEDRPLEWSHPLVVTVSKNGLSRIAGGVQSVAGDGEDALVSALNKFKPFVTSNTLYQIPDQPGFLNWLELEDEVALNFSDRTLFTKVSDYEFDRQSGQVTKIIFAK